MLASSQRGQAQHASSGIHEALLDRDQARSMSGTWDAIDGLYADTATNALRTLACMARMLPPDYTITLVILTEMPENATASPTKSTVVIDPDMFGADYRVVTWRPGAWGSNPTKQALMGEAVKNKQETFYALRDEVGDPDPYGTMAQIFAEDTLMNTPE
jgi:hypothetical protein